MAHRVRYHLFSLLPCHVLTKACHMSLLPQLPLRNRTGIQRPKNPDENATSKLRHTISTTLPSSVRGGVSGANALKMSGVQRPALGEVAINRKVRVVWYPESCSESNP
jgi:hypothetical protein